MQSLEEVFKTYKPKEEFTIYAFKSKETDKYVALVSKKVPVYGRYGKDTAEASILSNSWNKLDDFITAIAPYIEPR